MIKWMKANPVKVIMIALVLFLIAYFLNRAGETVAKKLGYTNPDGSVTDSARTVIAIAAAAATAVAAAILALTFFVPVVAAVAIVVTVAVVAVGVFMWISSSRSSKPNNEQIPLKKSA